MTQATPRREDSSHSSATKTQVPNSTSPSTVATRKGSTEKFTHALSHSRTNRLKVYVLSPAFRASCCTSIEPIRCVTWSNSPSIYG